MSALPNVLPFQRVDGHYAKIPHEYHRSWMAALPRSAHRLLGIVIDETTGNNRSVAALTHAMLQDRMGSESTVKRALRFLISIGAVKADRLEGGRTKGGKGVIPLYSWSREALDGYAKQHYGTQSGGLRSTCAPQKKGVKSEPLSSKRRGSSVNPPSETRSSISSVGQTVVAPSSSSETQTKPSEALKATSPVAVPGKPPVPETSKALKADDDEQPRTQLVPKPRSLAVVESIPPIPARKCPTDRDEFMYHMVRLFGVQCALTRRDVRNIESCGHSWKALLEACWPHLCRGGLTNPVGFVKSIAKQLYSSSSPHPIDVDLRDPDAPPPLKCPKCKGSGFDQSITATPTACDCDMGAEIARSQAALEARRQKALEAAKGKG